MSGDIHVETVTLNLDAVPPEVGDSVLQHVGSLRKKTCTVTNKSQLWYFFSFINGKKRLQEIFAACFNMNRALLERL